MDFEVDSTVRWVQQHGFERVALQFPDSLLGESVRVAALLRERLAPAEVYVMGDTSYGSCCVDEVAAEHVDADAVVHYGDSCLSRTSKLPVLYVFACGGNGGDTPDWRACGALLAEQVRLLGAPSVIVLAELQHQHHLDDLLQSAIQSHAPLGGVLCGAFAHTEFFPSRPQTTAVAIAGRTLRAPPGFEVTGNTVYVWVGADTSKTLANLVLTNPYRPIFGLEPHARRWRRENATSNRALMKRFYMIQRARDADAFGILMGTLGVASYMAVLAAVRELLRAHKRKFYVFALGKLNVAKLGNFPEIGCFVNIACPQNTLIDSKEFYQPVITPWELLCSVYEERWVEQSYRLGFDDLLREVERARVDTKQVEEEDEERPHFSLIGGRMKSNFAVGRLEDDDDEEEEQEEEVVEERTLLSGKGGSDNSGAVAVRNAESRIVKSAQTMFSHLALQQREFQGLEQPAPPSSRESGGGTPVEPFAEGRSGIARDYS